MPQSQNALNQGDHLDLDIYKSIKNMMKVAARAAFDMDWPCEYLSDVEGKYLVTTAILQFRDIFN